MRNNPLVFIHGAGDNARVWRAQVAFFGEQAIAIDLPGHGTRPDSLPEEVKVRDYALAVQTILREELRLHKPIIVGHSLGGLIALEMGLTFGEDLGGLVLIGTGARMRVLPALLEAARTSPDRALLSLKQMSAARPDEAEQPAPSPREQLRPESSLLYRDLLACNTFDVMGQLQNLRLPVLILCGAQERNAPVKYSQYLHTSIAGSMLKILPDAAHYVQREQAEAVNQAIADWLKSN